MTMDRQARDLLQRQIANGEFGDDAGAVITGLCDDVNRLEEDALLFQRTDTQSRDLMQWRVATGEFGDGPDNIIPRLCRDVDRLEAALRIIANGNDNAYHAWIAARIARIAIDKEKRS